MKIVSLTSLSPSQIRICTPQHPVLKHRRSMFFP